MCQKCYISVLLKTGPSKPVKWGVKLAKVAQLHLPERALKLPPAYIIRFNSPGCATTFARKGIETVVVETAPTSYDLLRNHLVPSEHLKIFQKIY